MRKPLTFILFLILVIIVFILASCASTEKLLETKTKSEVAWIEQKRFERKQPLPNNKVWTILSVGTFAFVCIIHNTKDSNK